MPTDSRMSAGLRGTAAALLFGASTLCAAQTQWDMPTGYGAGNFHTENLQWMSDEVAKATKGRLKIALHPNGALFKANEIKGAVQNGKAQIGEVFMSTLANESQVYAVDSIPFLATSYADAYRLWQASRPVIEKLLDQQGLRLLYAVPWPPQGIYVNRPIHSAADMKGLKWRAYNPPTTRIGELVGAEVVTIQAADLPRALADGSVNSFMSSSATGIDIRAWESVPYFYKVNAWLPKNMVIVNKQAFEALDKPTQSALLHAAAEAEKRGWKLSEEKNRGYLEALAKNNVQVLNPNWRFRLEIDRIGRIMIGEWLQASVAIGNSDGKVILDNYLRGVAQRQ